jgi:hypothetical protein
MKGLLIHNTKSVEKILITGKLKSRKNLSKTPEYNWDGPDDIPLIFFNLMFEDKVCTINDKIPVEFFISSTLFFNSKLLKDLGSKRLRIKSEYKKFFTRKEKYIRPNRKIWFNTDWSYGVYNPEGNKSFSVDYDENLSLNKNIQLFHDAKVISMEKNNFKYSSKYRGFYHNNEIVIFDEDIDISKYLLGIYIKDEDLYIKLKTKYPQYNIMNKEETNKFILNYFE